jgi:hypothetical protein
MKCPKAFGLTCILLFSMSVAQAQEWRDNMALLVYSPRYFGPSAFPIPELHQGKVPMMYEIEARGQYHYYVGDQTHDIFLRALLPIVRGRAGIEVSFLAWEKYKMTPETREERHAAPGSSQEATGDVVASAFFQLLESEEWIDALFSFTLKTASGGRLSDARFTDAPAYRFDLAIGRDLAGNFEGNYYLRLVASAGFYCWATNSMVHRQNDAWAYGAGLAGGIGKLAITSDVSGFRGYERNGDNLLAWRNNLQLDLNNNVISLRYNHGIRDFLYDTYSIGFIRRF